MIFLSLAFMFLFLSIAAVSTQNLILANFGLWISAYLFLLAALSAIYEIFLPGSLWIGIG